MTGPGRPRRRRRRPPTAPAAASSAPSCERNDGETSEKRRQAPSEGGRGRHTSTKRSRGRSRGGIAKGRIERRKGEARERTHAACTAPIRTSPPHQPFPLLSPPSSSLTFPYALLLLLLLFAIKASSPSTLKALKASSSSSSSLERRSLQKNTNGFFCSGFARKKSCGGKTRIGACILSLLSLSLSLLSALSLLSLCALSLSALSVSTYTRRETSTRRASSARRETSTRRTASSTRRETSNFDEEEDFGRGGRVRGGAHGSKGPSPRPQPSAFVFGQEWCVRARPHHAALTLLTPRARLGPMPQDEIPELVLQLYDQRSNGARLKEAGTVLCCDDGGARVRRAELIPRAGHCGTQTRACVPSRRSPTHGARRSSTCARRSRPPSCGSASPSSRYHALRPIAFPNRDAQGRLPRAPPHPRPPPRPLPPNPARCPASSLTPEPRPLPCVPNPSYRTLSGGRGSRCRRRTGSKCACS